METITARVAGFDTSGSFTTYTTEVTLQGGASGPSWLLAVRYSTFQHAYSKLVALDNEFQFDFPPKGSFWSSPSPKEREPQLNAFVQKALAHLAKREFDHALCEVMEDLLDVTENMARLKEPEAESEMENDHRNNNVTKEDKEDKEEPQEPLAEDKSESTNQSEETPVAPAVVLEEVAVVEAVVQEPAPVVVVAVDKVETTASIITTTTTTTTKTKPKTAASAVGVVDSLTVTSTTTTTTTGGVEVQHITFANGMSLKKKTLTAEQKKLRNARRKEKRTKKKSGLKIRGTRSASRCLDGTSTEEEEEGDSN